MIQPRVPTCCRQLVRDPLGKQDKSLYRADVQRGWNSKNDVKHMLLRRLPAELVHISEPWVVLRRDCQDRRQ